MALDETLDEAFSGQGLFRYSPALGPEQRLQQQMAELGHGAIVALVAKPGMIGGFERADHSCCHDHCWQTPSPF